MDAQVEKDTLEAVESCKMLLESIMKEPKLWHVPELSFLRDFLGGVH